MYCLWINMWIIEHNSCSKICPAVDVKPNMCSVSQKEASPPAEELKSNTWWHLWCALTNHGFQVPFEPKRFLQLSVAGQAASLQLLVAMNDIRSGPQRSQMWFKAEWWALLPLLVIADAWCNIFAHLIFRFWLPFMNIISHKHNEENEGIAWWSGWGRCG